VFKLSEAIFDTRNIAQRVFYAASKYMDDNKFDNSFQSVHADEKWFFLTEEHLRLYIAIEKEAPNQSPIQKKDHITKVMLLCAIARPRCNDNCECLFDCKIGMWPIVEYRATQRRSDNHERADFIIRPVNYYRDKYRELMIEKVLPAIKEKWLHHEQDILIQQNEALAPIFANDIELGLHARAGNLNIRIETQPAKLPDTNVLDLSFFRAQQSLQWKSSRANIIDRFMHQV
jgi:hypothetical protein